ncbi:cytochrome D1 domain-containing protein [uncultured Sphingomonas sp.]|uniref:cytochrome D1 domain-containing protein n=1 Tax=uncultured Sphingomonas sp. TaxID=158754 RepID=UPI0025FC25D1|nr:cytochrome D1 domain-containing protein [uncultured Sphingomonas sp.]
MTAILAASGTGAVPQRQAAPAPRATLLVVNQKDATLSIVDPETKQVVAKIDQGTSNRVHAHEVAVSRDGRSAFLPIYSDVALGKPGIDGHQMLAVDLPSRLIAWTLDFGSGVRPHLPVVDPVSGLLYVTTERKNAVTVIDPARRRILGTIPTGAEQSHMLALSHDGRFGYTANVAPGSVSVLDLKRRKTLAVIPVAGGVQRIAVSTDDRWLFTADTQQNRLAVIDARKHLVDHWITLPGMGYGAAAMRDGRHLLVALPLADQVAVIDLVQGKVVRTIAVGTLPQEILIRPDGRTAYVSCGRNDTVTVLDLDRWEASATIATGPAPDGLAWAGR